MDYLYKVTLQVYYDNREEWHTIYGTEEEIESQTYDLQNKKGWRGMVIVKQESYVPFEEYLKALMKGR